MNLLRRLRHAGHSVVLVLSLTAIAPGQAFFMAAPAAPGGRTQKADHADRCVAAIDLAVLAAESGVLDVSVEAMRRASLQGPPVASVDLGGILGSPGRPRVVRTGSNQENEAATARAELARRLCRLHDVWKEKKADPQLAYEAWKSLVLPPDRPSEAFVYSTEVWNRNSISYQNVNFSPATPKLARCGAAALVEWAREADQVEDLRGALAERESLPGASAAVRLLRAILAAEESSPTEEASTLCETFADQTSLLTGDANARLLFGHVWALVERLGVDSATSQELIASVIASIRSDDGWPANAWLTFLVDRNLVAALDSGDFERFQSAAELSMSRYDRMRANNESYVASREADLYTRAAQQAFQSGHVEFGVRCLKVRSGFPDTDRYGGLDGRSIVDPTRPIMKSLLAMSRQERYDALAKTAWTSRGLGMRRRSRPNITDRIPALFLRSLPEGPPWRQLVADDAPIYSLLEWAMRDAIALGRQADIEERIAELEESGSDDAAVAKTVYQLAKGEPIDLSLFAEQSDDGVVSLRPAYGETGGVSPLDLCLIDQALGDSSYADAGRRFLENRLEVAKGRRELNTLTILRHLKHERRVNDESPATQSLLTHWVSCDEVFRSALLSGLPSDSVWTPREDGRWGHDFGPDLSHLVMRYPMRGEFSITLRTKDQANGESGVAYDGQLVEFLRQNGAIWLWSIANRNGRHDIKTDALNKDADNTIRLVCSGESVTLRVNDNFEKLIGKQSGAFPFFGLSGYRFRTTDIGDIEIEGDVEVPRSVEMASPTMLGWTTRFTGGSLPALAVNPVRDSPALDTSALNRPDWRFVDGEFASVDHEAEVAAERAASESPEGDPYEEERRESLVQYLRPLCDGEQVSLEFFFEPGKHAAAPAVGRIAILLDGPEIALHWVTGAPAEWTGVEETNRVVDPDAEQPAPPKLREKDWNEVVVRIEGDSVLLTLNGEQVYRRAWEREAGRMFGLFHDPKAYGVRVRNLRLSGDWPEKLPSDVFERKPDGTM